VGLLLPDGDDVGVWVGADDEDCDEDFRPVNVSQIVILAYISTFHKLKNKNAEACDVAGESIGRRLSKMLLDGRSCKASL